MCESQRGKPFCNKAKEFVKESDADGQCKGCSNLLFIGCPGFDPKVKVADPKVRNYLKWWHGEGVKPT